MGNLMIKVRAVENKEPLFKIYKKQYIYSSIEDSEVYLFFNVIMRI
jgi:hypothetical protein